MPTDAMVRPAELYPEGGRPSPRWSPTSSDSGDESSSLDFETEEDRGLDEVAPAAPPAQPSTRPALGLRLQHTKPRNPSPPRSSPLSPLAAGGAARPSMGSAGAGLSSAGSAATSRARLSPLAPMSTSAASPTSPRPFGAGKSQQPLARSLLARAVTGASAPQRPKKTTKLIVPKQQVRTTFELGLSADELARKG